MRGIFKIVNIIIPCLRFNPAYAGNILEIIRKQYKFEVQPRVCGEYLILSSTQSLALGSTPRMRGICFMIRINSKSVRFNPAYAGNIPIGKFNKYGEKVQPRVCGEYKIFVDGNMLETGSTPRMRGIFAWFNISSLLIRFNPAYAGNIIFSFAERLINEVQPRVCGEYQLFLIDELGSQGSTPRMRGISYFYTSL